LVNIILDGDTSTVTDIDGNVYATVQIGEQLWMAENLKVTHYRNGDAITTGYSDLEWADLFDIELGGYSIYANDTANYTIYGNLYNWYAVDDERNICPEGWHIPTDNEWKSLELTLELCEGSIGDLNSCTESDGCVENKCSRGTDEGSQIAGNYEYWADGELESNSEFSSSGFVAYPGGIRLNNSGIYLDINHSASFWTSSEESLHDAWGRTLFNFTSSINRYNQDKPVGCSVRCLAD